ncbi:hypothetical protein F5Y16DRAFT_357249 [Xylariaceae sp. FL0255]|nr:hypothetical protein F5Y16DRAFT_357249 [Xylariaceae sp. FL0255]
MKIRYRGPTGVGSLDIAEDATVAQLSDKLASQLGFEAITLKYGWPPRTLTPDQSHGSVRELGLHRENLTVVPIENKSPPAPAQAPSPKSPPPPLRPENDIVKVVMPESGSALVLRVMPDDGDCLFTAVSGALSGLIHSDAETEDYTPATLRRIVVGHIQRNPARFTATMLEKDPATYCRNMLRPGVWGGAIELGILAEIFHLEICAVDIANHITYRFGEGKNYEQFAIVVYSGVHYDRIAEVLIDGQDDFIDFDVTRWSTVGNEHVLRAAKNMCERLHQQHYYTNTSDFLVSCDTCGVLLQGESQIIAHTNSTGHIGVTEIKD